MCGRGQVASIHAAHVQLYTIEVSGISCKSGICASYQDSPHRPRSMSHLEVLNVDEFADYLEEEGIGEEVVKSFKENKICSATFLELQNDELKELVPVVGSRVKVRKLLENVTQVRHFHVYIPA